MNSQNPNRMYGVLSLRRTVPPQLLQKNLMINLVFSQTAEDALRISREECQLAGANPNDWDIGHLVVWADISSYRPDLAPKLVTPNEIREEKKDKSVEELSAYVRYVFATATPEEKAVSEKVISQFKQTINEQSATKK